jgi:hypothetical protein
MNAGDAVPFVARRNTPADVGFELERREDNERVEGQFSVQLRSACFSMQMQPRTELNSIARWRMIGSTRQ